MKAFHHIVVDSLATLELDTTDDHGTTRVTVNGAAGERIVIEIRNLSRLILGEGPVPHPKG